MPSYSNLNMHKNTQNMHKYAKICSDPICISPMHSYAFICTKYAKICKICKHESYMQNTQKCALPTLLMPVGTQSRAQKQKGTSGYLMIFMISRALIKSSKY